MQSKVSAPDVNAAPFLSESSRSCGHLNKVELACRIARRISSIVYSDINGCCRSVKKETAFCQANHSSDSFLDEAAQSKCYLAERLLDLCAYRSPAVMLRTPRNRDRFVSDRNAHTYQVEHAKGRQGFHY